MIDVKNLKKGDYVVVINNNNTILELDKTYKVKQILYSGKFDKYYITLIGHNDLIYRFRRFKLDIKTERKHKIEKIKNYESI